MISEAQKTESFISEGGLECLLHEFGPAIYSSPVDSSANMSTIKKRGRPKKGFEKEKMSYQERKEWKEQRRQERKMNRMLMKSQKQQASYNSSRSDSFSGTPRKRGRPRKYREEEARFEIYEKHGVKVRKYRASDNDQVEESSQSEIFTPACSEASSDEEFSMIDMLKLGEEQQTLSNDSCETMNISSNKPTRIRYGHSQKQQQQHQQQTTEEINWTPMHRLVQLNQALAFTHMYKDFIFWDRITAEFMLPSIRFRLEFGNEKAFDLPLMVVSKFFWIAAQCGMQRIQFLHSGISEQYSSINNGVLFNSSDGLIYTQYSSRKYEQQDQVDVDFNSIMVQHRTNQFIEFDANAKISAWTIKCTQSQQFINTTNNNKEEEEFYWGFPKRVFDFLEAALVMISVLPDSASWITWFYTYIQQNHLQSYSIMEHVRPPSTAPLQIDNAFYDRERDFIFSVLNSVAVVDAQVPETAINIVDTAPESSENLFDEFTGADNELQKQQQSAPVTLDLFQDFEYAATNSQPLLPENSTNLIESIFNEVVEPQETESFESNEPFEDNESSPVVAVQEEAALELVKVDLIAACQDEDNDDFFDSYN